MSEIFESIRCRATLADFVQLGVCDKRIIELIKTGSSFLPIECELLDYKELLPVDTMSTAKIIRHILAFYNTYGGYLLFGIRETIKDTQFDLVGCTTLDGLEIKQLTDKIYSYTGVHIALSKFEYRCENDQTVVILFIPKRMEPQPAFFGKEGPQDESKKTVFKKNDYYLRRGDNSEPAVGEGFSFLFGSRECPYLQKNLDSKLPRARVYEHNLPDRNFICPQFIGRAGVIDLLWMWFADSFSYVRVLAGEGGLGKTSIAYEFAMQVYTNSPIELERVLWVTAKTKQFSGERDEFIPVPQTHFNSYTSLLETLCAESAIPKDQVDGADDNLLKRFLKDALQILPSFIVVDDVDSLSSEDQKRVLELAMQMGSTKSRFLLTTRKNVTYSPDIAIEVQGLSGIEYVQYLELLRTRFKGPELKEREIENLNQVTHGSPLFTDSLYRLIKQGHTVKKATDDWRGKKGIEARAAALLAEIESLSDESKRVLLAVAIYRSCSRIELSHASKYLDETLDDCLNELSSYYLISAPRIGNEPRYEVLETMYSLVVQIKERLVPGAIKFETEILSLRRSGDIGRNLNKTMLVGNAISEASALLRENDIEGALNTVGAAQRRSHYHADLYLMQGKCYMSGTPTRPDDARRAFSKAFAGGVRKPLLFELWYESEMQCNHAVGAMNTADLAINEKIRREGYWEVRKASAQVAVAGDQAKMGHFSRAIQSLINASILTFENVNKLPPQDQFAAKETLSSINDEIIKLGKKNERDQVNCIDMVETIIKMTERNDFRRVTLVNLLHFLVAAFSISYQKRNKFTKDSIELKHKIKLRVIRTLENAKNMRSGDQVFVDELLDQAKQV